LATTRLVDPVTAREHAPALDRAVADLHYGAIGVNEWAVMSLNFGNGTWGGFPGHTPDAIGSGTGTVGNAFQLREPQMTVLSYAFRPRIKPLTSVTNRTAGTTLRRALAYWTSDDLVGFRQRQPRRSVADRRLAVAVRPRVGPWP
jgi:hypothetical protein